jgi:NADH-quinone oxidoreductase subunit N
MATASIHFDLLRLSPIIVPFITALLFIGFISAYKQKDESLRMTAHVLALLSSIAGFVLAMVNYAQLKTEPTSLALSGFVRYDKLGYELTALIFVVLFIGISVSMLDSKVGYGIEKVSLMLISAAGMISMCFGNNLLGLFVSLEVFSIPLYVLVSLSSNKEKSLKGGLTYFVMGAVASGILVYGVALFYASTGSTQLWGNSLDNLYTTQPVFIISLILVVIGFLFKVGCLPFSFWVPKAYESAPLSTVAFMSAGSKIAATAALLRMFSNGYVKDLSFLPQIKVVLIIAAVVSAIFGAASANRQNHFVRIFAYSSMVHAAFLVASVMAGSDFAKYYLVAYSLTASLTFAWCAIWAHVTQEYKLTLPEFYEVSRTHPFMAAVLVVLLFSNAGIPMTVGFLGKFYVAQGLIEADLLWLALVLLFASIASTVAYLKVLSAIFYSKEEIIFKDKNYERRPQLRFVQGVLAVGAVVVVVLGSSSILL